jgi:C-terminal processing protease CtpA/Prc
MELLSNADRDFKENEAYFNTSHTKFKDMMENYNDSDYFKEALQQYSKEFMKVKSRLKETAAQTKKIVGLNISSQNDLSSHMSDYQSSVNDMSMRLDYL